MGSVLGSFFVTILHSESDEIGWTKMVFCKYVIILNRLTIYLFFDPLIKERFCCFFNNFWSLVDLLVRFEPKWSSDHLSENKERTELVEFPRNYLISFGSRWLVICFSRSPILGTFSAMDNGLGVFIGDWLQENNLKPRPIHT